MKIWEKLIVLIVFVAIVFWVNAQEYKEEQALLSYYCEMVEGGHWPDYDESKKCN